jgi:hypothetical protein
MITSRIQLATVVRFFRHYIVARALAFSVVCLVAVAKGQDSQQAVSETQPASNLPNQWVQLASRETKDGPTLVVTGENGKTKTYQAVADTMLIAYLADRAWGKLPRLSLILNDTNRVLLRFDPVAGDAVRRAELVLKLGDSPAPPNEPFDVSIYEVQDPWDENKVTWDSQPKIADEPAVKASLDPKAREFRIDVTELVKRRGDVKRGGANDAAKYGWLLKVTEPLAGGPIGSIARPAQAGQKRPMPANASAPSRSNIPPPPGKPQPFFNQWLWLPAIAIVLFGLSQTNLGFAQRIALRFSFAYWLLYFLPSPFGNLIPVYGFRLTMPYNSLVRKGVHWTATNVLGISQLFTGPTGSGDTTIEYIRLLNCFMLACAIAVVWSAVDWRRTDYPWLKDLLRSYLRYVLAFVMLSYGLAKAGPVMHQFSEPSLDQLMQTYADSSPMSLVWIFMGVSPAYTRFAGLGEVIGALLLLWRRTAILGAAVTFGVMLNVMMLNFCYDVPVKQYSFHLVLMAVYLLMADAPRLANLFLWNKPVEKASLSPPYTGPRTIWVQRALKAYIILMGAVWPYGTSIYRDLYPPENKLAQPAFYSSYEVDEFLVDGQLVPPILTDNTRWRYFGLHRSTGRRGATDALGIRMMDRSARGAWFVLSSDEKTITLNDRGSANVPKTMTVELPDDQHLTLSGTASGKKIEVKLHKLKREDSVLLNRGFHWINELPFRK